MNAADYAAYLQSPQWTAKRRDCLAEYDNRCQVCGCTSWRRIVDVHHLHYRNVGNERSEDIIPLCSKHHEMIHNGITGYGIEAVRTLRRECDEDNWKDPQPKHVRERQLNLRNGFESIQQEWICRACFARNEQEENSGSCAYCGTPQRDFRSQQATHRKESNAQILGFSDAEALNQAKDKWVKASAVPLA